MLVVLQQTGAWEARGDLLDDLLNLVVFELGVDYYEPLARQRQHHDLGGAFTMGGGRRLLLVREVDYLPPRGRKPAEQRRLDVVALVQLDAFGERGLHARILKQHRCSFGSVLPSITWRPRSPIPPRSLRGCRNAPSVVLQQAGGEPWSWPHTPAVDLPCCRLGVPPLSRSSRILYYR